MHEVFKDPVKASKEGFLENPGMKYLGMQRSEQLHLAYVAVMNFRQKHLKFPESAEEVDEVLKMANMINDEAKEAKGMYVE